MKIKTRLAIYFVVASVVAIMVPSGLAIHHIRTNAELEFEYLGREKLELGERLVAGFFQDLFDDASYFANLPLLNHLNEAQSRYVASSDLTDTSTVVLNEVERKLLVHQDDYRKTHPKIQGMYIGTQWGGFLYSRDRVVPDDMRMNYDPRKRVWYQASQENRLKSILSPPYLSGDGTVVMTVSKAIVRDNELIGVFGADILLKELEKIDTLTDSDSLILVTSSDHVVTYDPGYPEHVFRNMSELGEDYAWLSMQPDAQAARGVFHDEDVFMYAYSIPTLDWRMYLITPAHVVFEFGNTAVQLVMLGTDFICYHDCICLVAHGSNYCTHSPGF